MVPGACSHCPRSRDASLEGYPPPFPTRHDDARLVELEMTSRKGYQPYKSRVGRFSMRGRFKYKSLMYTRMGPIDTRGKVDYSIEFKVK